MRLYKNIFCLFLVFLLLSCSKNIEETTEESTSIKNTEIETSIKTPIDNSKLIEKDIVLLTTNDLHGATIENIGYAGLKEFYTSINLDENYVTLIDCGDSLFGNEYGTKENAKIISQIKNELQYEVCIPGDEDLKYGVDFFLDSIKDIKNKYTCCNFADLRTDQMIFPPYIIKDYGYTKIGFIGVTTPYAEITYEKSFFNEKGEQIYTLCLDDTGEQLYRQIQYAAKLAKDNGADSIILIAHLGNKNPNDRYSSEQVINNTQGIACILDSNSEEVVVNSYLYNIYGTPVPRLEAGKDFEYIGVMNILKTGYMYGLLCNGADKVSEDSIISMNGRSYKDRQTEEYILNILN